MYPSRQIWRGIDHKGNNWLIERYSDDLPNLVRWVKLNRLRDHKLLDQVSDWTGYSWNAARWVPSQPAVPRYIRQAVESHLQREVAP